jgi:hypothetical protein
MLTIKNFITLSIIRDLLLARFTSTLLNSNRLLRVFKILFCQRSVLRSALVIKRVAIFYKKTVLFFLFRGGLLVEYKITSFEPILIPILKFYATYPD